MKKSIIILFLILTCGCQKEEVIDIMPTYQTTDYNTILKQDLLCVMTAYGDIISSVIKENENVYIITKSNKKIIYDDKKQKNLKKKQIILMFKI